MRLVEEITRIKSMIVFLCENDGGYDVFDGRHRIFLAKKFNKPIKSIVLK